MFRIRTKAVKVDIEKVKKIEWTGDAELYDTELSRLGPRGSAFFVPNPWVENSQYLNIKDVPITNQCVVYTYKSNWVLKYFPPHWSYKKGYTEVEVDLYNIKPEFEDDFSNWAAGVKSSVELYNKIKANEHDKKSMDLLNRLCSKSVGEYMMHGALDAILFIKKHGTNATHKLYNPFFLKKLFKEIYKK